MIRGGKFKHKSGSKLLDNQQVDYRIEEPDQSTKSNIVQEIPECAGYQEEPKTHSMGTFLG